MSEVITFHALDLSGEIGLKLYLRKSDGTLLNTGGDALAEVSSSGMFQATLAEVRTGFGSLAVRVCDGTETADNLLYDGFLSEGSTTIGATVELDSGVTDQLDAMEAAIALLRVSESRVVERSLSDTNAITFAWPVSGATITGTQSINNGTYGAVTGAIAFLRTESSKHYYTLAFDAADRPTAEGQVRYKFEDGTYTRYVVLRTVTTVLADAAHGGAAATLVLSTIDIQPASADTPGVLIRGTGYAAGIDVKGGEYADGIKARSGDTSGYGICSNGVQGGARFWSTNGYGVRVSSDNSNAFSIYGGTYAFQINSVNNAIDVYSSTGNAVYLQSAQNDAVVIYPGADDIGVHIWGGQTSGDAVALDSNGSGSVVYPTSGGGGGGEGSASYEAVVVTRMPVGVTVGWPTELVIGDAYLTETLTAPKLFIRDIEDNVLAGLGSKAFSDGDFVGKLRLAPLTTSTRDSSLPAATVEVSSADTPGIVFNNDTADAEYFELQIPHAKTILGVVKTEYAAQFIMNWGADRTYERTVNLGKIKFIRKTSAAT